MRALASLICAAQGGDQDAFAELIDRFHGMAVRFVTERLADGDLALDVIQEAWLDAYLSLPTLRAPAAFSSWFRRILIKQCDRHLRKRRLSTTALDAADAWPSPQPDSLETLLRREEQAYLNTALNRLPDTLREVVVRCYREEQPQQIIAASLGIPLTTVKKRLYLARQWLGVYLLAPELDPSLALPHRLSKWTVPFWLALWAGDVDRVERLLRLDPTLAQQQEVALPALNQRLQLDLTPGFTPLHRTVAHNDRGLVAILLAARADGNAATPSGITPLHLAVLNDAVDIVQMLLVQGAAVNAPTTANMTPLHWAMLRRSTRLCALLGHGDASPALPVHIRQTPRHWEHQPAARVPRQQRSLAVAALLGRVVGPDGVSLDGRGPFAPVPQQAHCGAPRVAQPMLVTGIKAIDLFAPLRRGGIIAVQAAAGVGKLVLLCELIHRLTQRYHGCAVVLSYAEHAVASHRFVSEVRASGLTASVTHILCPRQASAAEQARCLAYALDVAGALAAEQEVLLLVEHTLVSTTNAWSAVRHQAGAQMTTLLYTADAPLPEAKSITQLDGQIVLSSRLARQGIYPAIDLQATYTSLLSEETLPRLHLDLVPAIRAILAAKRRQQSQPRTERLQWFQSQPFFLAEPFTARAGRDVDPMTTLRDYARILEGDMDALPLAAFHFAGALVRQ